MCQLVIKKAVFSFLVQSIIASKSDSESHALILNLMKMGLLALNPLARGFAEMNANDCGG